MSVRSVRSACAFCLGLLFPTLFFPAFCAAAQTNAVAPAGWGDFRFGLVNDGQAPYDSRMQAAVSDGVRLDYRYTYINSGANPASNAMSWLFTPYTDYVAESAKLGMSPAFVIYMLQEDGGIDKLKQNAQDPVFLAEYVATLIAIAQKSKGAHPIFIIEPDTWGYILQAKVDPMQAKTALATVAAQYAYLADLPADYRGLARLCVRVLKRFAPDAYVGLMVSAWAVEEADCPGPGLPDGYKGVAFRSPQNIDCSADRSAAFMDTLLGTGSDRGDFIAVEKNGHSAGWWNANLKPGDAFYDAYNWNDQQNANYLRWCARLSQDMHLPLVGWQISIGHPGLPNVCAPGPLSAASGINVATGNCAFEDTYFPYFFAHAQDFLAAGFIGFLAGKGLGDDCDYTYAKADPGMGDRGWFLGQLQQFDRGRPYLSAADDPSAVRPPLRSAMRSDPAYPYARFDARGRIVFHDRLRSRSALSLLGP